MVKPLIVIKLGGSIVTTKREGKPRLKRDEILRIAKEIKTAYQKNPFNLILIHGAGSFGHSLAKKYKLWEGLKRNSQIIPFTRTQTQTIFLNHAILETFTSCALPVMGINPTAVIIQKGGKLNKFDTDAVSHLLTHDFIPVLYGTVVPDKTLIGSICSGDTMLCYLAKRFHARRAVFASDVDGIFTQDPNRYTYSKLIPKINNNNYRQVIGNTQGSASEIDVGGGMRGKLEEIHKYSQGIETWIVNGETRGLIKNLLLEQTVKATRIFLT